MFLMVTDVLPRLANVLPMVTDVLLVVADVYPMVAEESSVANHQKVAKIDEK